MNERQAATLRVFRRRFLLARRAYAALEAGGGVGISINWANETLSSGSTGADEAAVTRFVVVMRHFLHPQSKVYFEAMWKMCEAVAGPVLTNQMRGQFQDLVAAMQRGSLRLTFNGNDVSAEEMYKDFSSGGFFDDDETARAFLDDLFAIPAAGTISRYMFVSYSISAFQITAMLFDILSRAGKFDRPATPFGPFQCIYCLRADGGFTAEEHVIPESLGNDDILLPAGLVCDACNNGVLSQLDEALLRFEPIAMLQVLFVPHTKGGRLPSANFENVKVEKTAPRTLRFTAKDHSGGMQEVEECADGRVRWKQNFRGRKFDPRLLGRALCKIGLGLVALDEGPAIARSSRYDDARRFICLDDGFANNLVIRTVGQPEARVTVTRNPSWAGTPFMFNIYGMIMMVNIETTPVLQVGPQFASFRLVSHSLDRDATSR